MEDVKTFFQLLLLLSTLFGHHVARDGFVIAHLMEMFSCPSPYLGNTHFNPDFVSSVLVRLSVPLTQRSPNAYKFTPNMLKRIELIFLVL